MKQLANLRKAVAGRDDATLTRWVKEPGRHSGHVTPPMPETATGTRFPSRVIAPADMAQVLVSGHSNVKIGRDVRKGHLRGYWIYTLSLEERATCPRSCNHWRDCYGNAMPFAKRVDHRDRAALEAGIERDVEKLLGARGRVGILVRLHALGDFIDPAYVQFWSGLLSFHHRLAVYGYTAHPRMSPIGYGVEQLNYNYGDRSMIRFSDGGAAHGCTVAIEREEDCPPTATVCPEQTGRVGTCAECALCWGTSRNIGFIAH